jgi:hypothetical protein
VDVLDVKVLSVGENGVVFLDGDSLHEASVADSGTLSP